MDSALLEKLNKARADRRSAVVVTDLGSDAGELLLAGDVAGHPLEDEIAKRLKSGKSGLAEIDGREVFVHIHVPPLRLVIIGAVHISQALVPMAQACDFDVSVIDPRTAFATAERFSSVPLFPDWPAEILPEHPLDPVTALVAVTPDPKIDDIPLKQALDTGCFYVGALGSRKTHAKRATRLSDMGCTQEQIDRIHSPIGLDIGASSPAEIAVAILAEIIQTRRKGDLA